MGEDLKRDWVCNNLMKRGWDNQSMVWEVTFGFGFHLFDIVIVDADLQLFMRKIHNNYKLYGLYDYLDMFFYICAH